MSTRAKRRGPVRLGLRKLAPGEYATRDGLYRAERRDHPEAFWLTYPDGVERKCQSLERARHFVRRHQEEGW